MQPLAPSPEAAPARVSESPEAPFTRDDTAAPQLVAARLVACFHDLGARPGDEGEDPLLRPLLAMLGAARGYRVILTMPESMSIERRKLAAAYGAELVLTPRAEGMAGAVAAAERIAGETEGAFLTRQFDNPANPAAHYATTGPEIDAALGSATLGAFAAGVGTGGTITGVGRYLREHRSDALVVAVEPAESPIIGQTLAGEPLTPGPHAIQGIGANFVPSVLGLDLISGVERVTGDEAITMARRLAAEEGLFVGISSGANVVAALRLAARPELAGTTIVTVAPSTGERYLSTPLWEGFGG